jgi:hypothetical protein
MCKYDLGLLLANFEFGVTTAENVDKRFVRVWVEEAMKNM